MTLNTIIYITKPVDHKHLHSWVNEHLLQTSNPRFEEKPNSIWNAPMQGLDAWFAIDWHDEPQQFDKDAPNEILALTYCASMWFDTPYRYSPAATHAGYIRRLVEEYFKPRDIDVVWENEFTGELWLNLDPRGIKRFENM